MMCRAQHRLAIPQTEKNTSPSWSARAAISRTATMRLFRKFRIHRTTAPPFGCLKFRPNPPSRSRAKTIGSDRCSPPRAHERRRSDCSLPGHTSRSSWSFGRHRLQLQESSCQFIGEQIQQAVWSLPDLGDSLFELEQQRLAKGGQSPGVQDDPLNLCAAPGAYEDVSFPRLELVACVKRQAGDRDGWHPNHERLFHARRGMLLCCWTGSAAGEVAAVRPPIRNDRPSVIATRFDDVDFVAAHGAVLVFPELARLRMNDQPENIPNPQSIDLGPVVGPADERIVQRRAPVVIEAKYFADMAGRIL